MASEYAQRQHFCYQFYARRFDSFTGRAILDRMEYDRIGQWWVTGNEIPRGPSCSPAAHVRNIRVVPLVSW